MGIDVECLLNHVDIRQAKHNTHVTHFVFVPLKDGLLLKKC